MGLDLALGGLVLFVAFRGWLRGFVVQAIRLVGLVTCVFAAVPVRDFVKPYAAQYLPTIRPELSDRLLWWVAAITCYFLIVGAASLITAASRRNTFGLTEKNRSDQFAGFGLGVLKGLVVASFLLGALQKNSSVYMDRVDWAKGQAKESQAWEWGEKYQPAAKIWTSQPVQLFVAHVQKYGLTTPARPGATDEPAETEKPVQTASRAPTLILPGIDGDPPVSIDTDGLDPALIREVEELQKDLAKLNVGK